MEVVSSLLQNPNLISKISVSLISITRASSDNVTSTLASGVIFATIMEIPKPDSISVEDIPAKSPLESSLASENGGDESGLPTITMEMIKFMMWSELMELGIRNGS